MDSKPERKEFEFGYGKIYHFSLSSRNDQEPNNGSRGFFSEVKRPGREANRSPTSVKVKKTWIYTSTPP
jgi:hypothetical protein